MLSTDLPQSSFDYVHSHFSNPVIAGVDIATVGALVAYWINLVPHPVSTVSTALAGLWYAFCLFEALERRYKEKVAFGNHRKEENKCQ